MTFPKSLTDGSIQVKQGRVTLSPENISALVADFMVIYNRGGDIAEVEKIPGYADLSQVKSGATVAGLNTPTSLSRAWVLEQVKPTLEKISYFPEAAGACFGCGKPTLENLLVAVRLSRVGHSDLEQSQAVLLALGISPLAPTGYCPDLQGTSLVFSSAVVNRSSTRCLERSMP